MTKMKYSFKAKIVAFIILILLSFFAIISAIGIYYGVETRIYYGIDSYYDTYIFENKAYRMGHEVINVYIHEDEDYFADKYSSEKSNLRFAIYANDRSEEYEYANFLDDEYVKHVGRFIIDDYIIELNVVNPITVDDGFYDDYNFFNCIYSLRYALVIFLLLSIIFIVLDMVFLFLNAGYRDDTGEIYLNFFDKIPFDILVLGETLVICMIYNFIYNNFFYSIMEIIPIDIIVIVCTFVFFVIIGAITALSFAVRIKKGVFIQQLFITKTLKIIIKSLKMIGSSALSFFRMLPYIWQGALITLFIIFLNIFLILAISVFWTYEWVFLFLWVVFNIIVFLGICFGLFQMNKLKELAKVMVNGDFETKLNTDKMYFHFKEHANNLNNISKGMNIAIEERIKSEHLKTELITNVSHDIKTPLTSIINYVDLMKQEEISNEDTKRYLSVIDKQSIRLKKLLEDLVEVSKASTGNITIENTPCELNVLLGQVVGEYKERLEKEGLELIISAPEESIVILGDGRHLWRMFDNLLNNICKYAQERTRVYLTLEKQGERAVITFRNISEYPLNITSEELMERFVRGDKSRHTEGSGLGLSIAKNLAQLQNGTMDIVIDGDLFKVILAFNLYKEDNLNN